jgi:DNA-directed RNA polymerase subunit RPC12/RpoP
MSVLNTIRACDVLNLALDWHGASPITDSEMHTQCPGCQKKLTLDKCPIQREAEPAYTCPECSNTVLSVSVPGCGRGYRLKDYVIIPEADLHFRGVVCPPTGKERQRLS